MTIKRHEDLDIWVKSIQITKQIYILSAKAPFSNDKNLQQQIRRAIVSVSSNIVEGFEKNNNKEFLRFLRIAKGSAGEVRNQISIAYELAYINFDDYSKTFNDLELLSKKISALMNYLKTKLL